MPGARHSRTFHVDHLPVDAVLGAKGTTSVSVCLPARNEEATVGDIVAAIRRDLVDGVCLVDEVLVVDDHSTDGTAAAARAAGARVESAADLLPGLGDGHGKGTTLWKSVYAAEGDVVAWVDADIRDFDTRFVLGLIGPLLLDPAIGFVKGFYDRPDDGVGGGRVTELLARPVIALLHPQLSFVQQPLSGEYAGRRSVLEQLPFAAGYGVDLGLLLDVVRRFGPATVAQTDLGLRTHRNRSLEQLAPQATEVLAVALDRAGVDTADPAVLVRPDMPDVLLPLAERPPLVDVADYVARRAMAAAG